MVDITMLPKKLIPRTELEKKYVDAKAKGFMNFTGIGGFSFLDQGIDENGNFVILGYEKFGIRTSVKKYKSIVGNDGQRYFKLGNTWVKMNFAPVL